ncbi:MAG: hypothetical protein IKF59_05950 [Lachnospiraceae bacterium]|nr:hypothetical protein [Lachnospiraceae bacterium]
MAKSKKSIDTVNTTQETIFTGNVPQAQARYNIGRDSVMKVAQEAGAVVRIGKRTVINFPRMDAYLDSISGT